MNIDSEQEKHIINIEAINYTMKMQLERAECLLSGARLHLLQIEGIGAQCVCEEIEKFCREVAA